MLVRQNIPLREEKKTLSHIVTRIADHSSSRRRRLLRVPELPSNKFFIDESDWDLMPCKRCASGEPGNIIRRILSSVNKSKLGFAFGAGRRKLEKRLYIMRDLLGSDNWQVEKAAEVLHQASRP